MNGEVDRFEKRDLEIVTEYLMCKTTAEWLEIRRNDNAWAGPICDVTDVVDVLQFTVNGSFVEYDHHTEGRVNAPGFPIRFQRTPAKVRYRAPNVGEYTRKILADVGYSTENIDALAGSGVVSAP